MLDEGAQVDNGHGVIMLFTYAKVTNAAHEAARAASGLSLDHAVQKTLYDSSTGPSVLGGLPMILPSFNVGSDVVVPLTTSTGAASDKSDPQPGDRVRVKIEYRYTMPVVSQVRPRSCNRL